jgi:hypothetical protein
MEYMICGKKLHQAQEIQIQINNWLHSSIGRQVIEYLSKVSNKDG